MLWGEEPVDADEEETKRKRGEEKERSWKRGEEK